MFFSLNMFFIEGVSVNEDNLLQQFIRHLAKTIPV